MLKTLFEPASVAVIGASRTPRKVGYAVLNNLLKFNYRGRIYPVNPSADMIQGLKAYPSIDRIKKDVELAVIAIPAQRVPEALRTCIGKGVKCAVVISAGFKESGSEGAVLEQTLKGIVKSSRIRLLGPNCLGIINTGINLNATFAKWMLPKGNISFFSQSGALGIAVLDWAIGNRIGFSKFISIGNKVDLNETDFIRYLTNDRETDVIIGYIEDVVHGARFLQAAKHCTAKKPIILIKSGGTQAGARAASSHTGALAGSEHAFDAAFKQTGIIRAAGVEKLFEIAKIFSTGKIPRSDRIVILTNAGGPGIIAADQAEKSGLTLPLLNEKTIKRLSAKLPKNASLYNPVDVIGDANSERYSAVLEELVKNKDSDGIIIILTPQAMTDVDNIAEVVISASKRTRKPVVTSFMGAESVKRAVEKLKQMKIPNYSYPENAVTAYKELAAFSAWQRRATGKRGTFSMPKDRVRKIIDKALSENRFTLGEEDSRCCLMEYGFVFPRQTFVTDKKAAARESARIGFPVVMKVSSPDVLHKTDLGGVITGIQSRKEAERAFVNITTEVKKRMPQALVKGVNVYEMISSGKEVIAGVTHDRTFGHMLMFGLGGIYVEVLKDVSFRIIPVTETDVRDMMQEIKAYSLLKGTRGEGAVDIDAIADALLRLNQLITDFPEIHELDINPLRVKTEGTVALDARIIIHGG
jgi:acetyltransferase